MINFAVANRPVLRELLAFLVGAQELCADVMGVREILVWAPATPIANAPSFLCDIINLRGVVIPIIDLAVRLGMPPAIPTSRHAILVVEIRGQVVGLLVEGVSEILTVNSDAIQVAPDILSQMAQEMIDSILALEGRPISMIDLEAVLPGQSLRIAA